MAEAPWVCYLLVLRRGRSWVAGLQAVAGQIQLRRGQRVRKDKSNCTSIGATACAAPNVDSRQRHWYASMGERHSHNSPLHPHAPARRARRERQAH
jgi:hypothetical protein